MAEGGVTAPDGPNCTRSRGQAERLVSWSFVDPTTKAAFFVQRSKLSETPVCGAPVPATSPVYHTLEVNSVVAWVDAGTPLPLLNDRLLIRPQSAVCRRIQTLRTTDSD